MDFTIDSSYLDLLQLNKITGTAVSGYTFFRIFYGPS